MFFEGLIESEKTADTKAQAIDELCELLYKEGRISSVEALKAEILKREAEISTDLTPDISIPHAKTDAVLVPSVAAMKTKDNKRIYLIASNSDEAHINSLAKLSIALLDEKTPPAE